jgi:hypothetical protein
MSGTEESTTPEQVEGKVFTQEQLDEMFRERVSRAVKPFEGFDTYKSKAEQFDALQAKGPAGVPDSSGQLSELSSRVTEAERVAAEAATKLVRLEVATDKGITKDHLALLTASSRDELVAQADAILRLTAGSGRVPGQGGRDANAVGGTVSAGRDLFESRKK